MKTLRHSMGVIRDRRFRCRALLSLGVCFVAVFGHSHHLTHDYCGLAACHHAEHLEAAPDPHVGDACPHCTPAHPPCPQTLPEFAADQDLPPCVFAAEPPVGTIRPHGRESIPPDRPRGPPSGC
ncbi:MAG: hypothetical protein GXY15_08825 [Candidatus Hydrogenedentes bacterium]|nr:hypothetical protein [Candidatus Hydrogenedentota bacterium]